MTKETKKLVEYNHRPNCCRYCIHYLYSYITWENGKHEKCEVISEIEGKIFSPLKTSCCNKFERRK